MKKSLLACLIIGGLTACGGYTEEQGKAADAFCECMESDTHGDFSINWFECEAELKENYGVEVLEEGTWIQALEEKCSEVADKME